MSKEFIDSNVIVYANDAAAGDKQNRSIDLVTRLLEDGSGVILAAADAARCTVLWSEGFEPGTRYLGITVRSPFRE